MALPPANLIPGQVLLQNSIWIDSTYTTQVVADYEIFPYFDPVNIFLQT